MKKKKLKRTFDFRIKYEPEDSVESAYHYYNCYSASEALSFQRKMMEHQSRDFKILSVERQNPYSELWEDESEVLEDEGDCAK